MTARTAETHSSFWFFAFAGLALRLSPALDPIHEMMHWIAVELCGGEVSRIEWSRIWWTGAVTRFPLIAGYWFELFLYFLIHMWKRRGFAFGALPVVWVVGMISEDFARFGSNANIILYGFVGLILFGVALGSLD